MGRQDLSPQGLTYTHACQMECLRLVSQPTLVQLSEHRPWTRDLVIASDLRQQASETYALQSVPKHGHQQRSGRSKSAVPSPCSPRKASCFDFGHFQPVSGWRHGCDCAMPARGNFNSRLLPFPTHQNHANLTTGLRRRFTSVPPSLELGCAATHTSTPTRFLKHDGAGIACNRDARSPHSHHSAPQTHTAPLHGLSRIGSATLAALTLHRLSQEVLLTLNQTHKVLTLTLQI